MRSSCNWKRGAKNVFVSALAHQAILLKSYLIFLSDKDKNLHDVVPEPGAYCIHIKLISAA